ncbi:MAG: DUF4435 domain-containing protein [Caldilinea sp. CFX5]|nr:DUF4435 domain-containing protein [Caldilinea sp. CFX5]
MNRLVTPGAIFVEGDSDRDILARWFPHLQFVVVNGKNNIHRRVEQVQQSWGLLDRDFADEAIVTTSRLPESRVFVLHRYCIENYLLEPATIATVAGLLVNRSPALQPWTDETHVAEQLLRWGAELAIYAAANRLVANWRAIIDDDFVRYFGPLPPLPREQVLVALSTRLAKLPKAADLPALLEANHSEILSDLSAIEGVHRWINGKVLLEEFLYPHVFKLHNFSQSRLRDELIKAGIHAIPQELVELAQRWGINKS